eukprot:896676-Pleurochrysis_carterae.AAC.1
MESKEARRRRSSNSSKRQGSWWRPRVWKGGGCGHTAMQFRPLRFRAGIVRVERVREHGESEHEWTARKATTKN